VINCRCSVIGVPPRGSAQPLVAVATSLIEKETLAIDSSLFDQSLNSYSFFCAFVSGGTFTLNPVNGQQQIGDKAGKKITDFSIVCYKSDNISGRIAHRT